MTAVPRPPPPPRVRADACPGVLAPHDAADGALARIRLPGGVLTAAAARAVADCAAHHGDGAAHLTSRGNLQLRALRRDDPDALSVLVGAGLVPSRTHERVRNVLASPLSGIAGGLADVRGLAARLDAAICAAPHSPACPGGSCSLSTTAVVTSPPSPPICAGGPGRRRPGCCSSPARRSGPSRSPTPWTYWSARRSRSSRSAVRSGAPPRCPTPPPGSPPPSGFPTARFPLARFPVARFPLARFPTRTNGTVTPLSCATVPLVRRRSARCCATTVRGRWSSRRCSASSPPTTSGCSPGCRRRCWSHRGGRSCCPPPRVPTSWPQPGSPSRPAPPPRWSARARARRGVRSRWPTSAATPGR
ncbi:hypothetical protein ACFQV8_20515 [Pseudonocardia benzenivorans]